MNGIVAALNVFGPSTLVLISLMLCLTLLVVRTYVHESRIRVEKSSLIWLDVAITALFGVFTVLVFLRFLYLS